jgi:hypothetical protein
MCQVSEVIAIRYKLEPLRFEVECELGPVTEYVNDDQLGEDDDFDVDFDFQQQQQQQFQFDVQRPSESHNNNHQQQQGGEATSGRKGGEGRGRRPSALSLDMTLLNIASPLSPPPPGSPLSPSPLSPSQALKPELVPLCTIGSFFESKNAKKC